MPLSPYLHALRQKIGTDLLLCPGVCALIFNSAGEILLQRRSDTGRWAVIGGMLEPGEQPADGLIREVFEETGLDIAPDRITGVYLTRIITYANGQQAQFVITAFRCRPIAGTPRVNDDESLEVRYFPLDALPELSDDHRQRIADALRGGPACFSTAQTKVQP
jgi:8-oxo-dGTP pyrophosphatase MutT (NUDIX family)